MRQAAGSGMHLQLDAANNNRQILCFPDSRAAAVPKVTTAAPLLGLGWG